jgi:flagellar biosynthesis protein FliP
VAYGQTRQVVIDRIYTKGTERMLENLVRKAKAADKMFDELIKYMYEGVKVENIYNSKTVEVPSWMR